MKQMLPGITANWPNRGSWYVPGILICLIRMAPAFMVMPGVSSTVMCRYSITLISNFLVNTAAGKMRLNLIVITQSRHCTISPVKIADYRKMVNGWVKSRWLRSRVILTTLVHCFRTGWRNPPSPAGPHFRGRSTPFLRCGCRGIAPMARTDAFATRTRYLPGEMIFF